MALSHEIEEELDVDETDLPSLLRPCKQRRHHHSLTRLIPGPAAQVQAQMQAQMLQTENDTTPMDSLTKPLQDHSDHFDPHFHSIPWTHALNFLGVEDGVIPSTPLSSIMSALEAGKVDRDRFERHRGEMSVGNEVVAVIKSCRPNGFGGLMVTLKDPTGMLDASIHHKVLSESEFGKDLLIGSVVILQKVAVFAPTRRSCYLNITLQNLVKVFKMDGDLKMDRDPSIKQVNASYKFVAPEKDCGGETSRLDDMSFSELGTNKEIQKDFRSCASMRQIQNDSLREKETEVPRNSSCQNEVSTNQSLAKRKFSSSGQDATSVLFEELPAEGNVDCGTTDARNTGAETQRASIVQNLTQPLLSRTSLPQYTDEQLNLLFDGGEDDDFLY